MNANTTSPIWSQVIGYMVNSVAIAADASRVVAGTYNHNYNLNTNMPFVTCGFDNKGNELWQNLLNTSSEGAYWVAISANGAYAAAGGKLIDPDTQAPSGFIQAYDAAKGNVLLDYRLTGGNATARVNKVALSRDGGVLAAVAGTTLFVSFLQNGAYTQPLVVPVMTGGDWVPTVAVSGDGSIIITGSSTGEVGLWAVSGQTVSRKASYTLPNGATCRCVNMNDSGDYFVACGGSSSTKGAACLFETAAFAANPQPLWTRSSDGPIYYMALADAFDGNPPLVSMVTNNPIPSGELGASSQGQLSVLQTTRGAAPLVLNTYLTQAPPNSTSLNAAGTLVAVADGLGAGNPGNFYLLDAQTLAVLWQYGTTQMSWPIVIAANANFVAAGSDDGAVYYFGA